MTASRILVLGATGATGRAVVEQAVEHGLEVTVLVRDPNKLPSALRVKRVVTGDLVAAPESLRGALAGQDAVISALGVGQSFKSRGLMATVVPRIVEAMRLEGVSRLVFTSAFGVGATWRDTPLLPRLFMATLLRDVYADKQAGEQTILASDLDWTIVYPVGLTNGPRTGRYRIGERLRLSGFPTISRADVAECLLRQVDDRTFVHKGVLVARS
jgi:putative NADH-flavin reductase